MSFKTRLLNKLLDISNKPDNAFEKIIAQNKDCLQMMSAEQLCEIETLRYEAAKLCKIVPYSRSDVASLIENDEVSPYNIVADLENHFLIIEHIFAEFKGEEI